jgi:hypothetical protein
MKSAIYIFTSYFHNFMKLGLTPEQLALLVYLISGGVHF